MFTKRTIGIFSLPVATIYPWQGGLVEAQPGVYPLMGEIGPAGQVMDCYLTAKVAAVDPDSRASVPYAIAVRAGAVAQLILRGTDQWALLPGFRAMRLDGLPDAPYMIQEEQPHAR